MPDEMHDIVDRQADGCKESAAAKPELSEKIKIIVTAIVVLAAFLGMPVLKIIGLLHCSWFTAMLPITAIGILGVLLVLMVLAGAIENLLGLDEGK